MRAALLIPLLLGYCADETTSGYADPATIYVLETIDGQPFQARATLSFPEARRISGDAPCNRFSGTQPAPYPWFEPGPIAATKRACPDLDAETAFFNALSQMTLVEVSGPVLVLSTPEGRSMVFRAAP